MTCFISSNKELKSIENFLYANTKKLEEEILLLTTVYFAFVLPVCMRME